MKYRGLLQLLAMVVWVIIFPFADRLMDSVGGVATLFAALGLAYLLATLGKDRYKEGRKC